MPWHVVAVALIVAIGGGLRVYRIDARSLWLDEIVTSQLSHVSGPGAVIAWAQADINQMPLFYMFTWLLGRWGDSATILRLPAAVAGTLTVLALYDLTRRLIGIRAGIIAAALAAALPFMVWYSQEARMYSLLMLMTTMQFVFAYRAVKSEKVVDWAGLALFTTLNLYTHYVALLATAAVGVYVGGSIASSLLHDAPSRVKVAAAMGISTLLVGAALVPWRAILAGAYRGLNAAVSGAGLRGGVRYAAEVAAVAGVAGAGIVLAGRSAFLHERPSAARRLNLATAAAAFVIATYIPWLPTLRVFLNSPDQSLGRLQAVPRPDLSAALRLLDAFGLSGLVLVVFVIGLAAVGTWMFRGRAAESGLILAGIVVQSVGFVALARSAVLAVNPRYMSCVFVVAIVITAAGGDVVATAIERVARAAASRGSLRVPAPGAFAGLAAVALLLAQALPALATSYGVPKEDYRAAARHIVAMSTPNPTVLAVGAFSDWAVICLQYYFREMGASAEVVDGLRLTSATAARLSGGGSVWGVVIFPSSDQLALLDREIGVKTDFVDVTGIVHVVRSSSPDLSALEQARAILAWEQPLESALTAPLELLTLLAGRAGAGENLIAYPASGPAGAGWSLPPGASFMDSTLHLMPTPPGSQITVAYTAPLPRAGDYLVAAGCTSAGFSGSQTIDAVPVDALGHPVPRYPGAVPFDCGSTASGTTFSFAIATPPDTEAIELVLSAEGTGTADFTSPQIRLIVDQA